MELFEPDNPQPVPECLDWRTIAIPKMLRLAAFVAGPIVPIRAHYPANCSKPCLRWITKGKMQCPWCGLFSMRRIGYLPLYLYPGLERRVVILCRTTMLPLLGIKTGDLVSMIQSKQPKQPAKVDRCTVDYGTQAQQQKRIQARPPADIRAYLLHLWQLPQLSEFFGQELPDPD